MKKITCQITGDSFEGTGITLKDYNLVECVDGHTFYESFILYPIDNIDEWRYDVPSTSCPICSLRHIDNDFIFKYIIKSNSISLENIKSEIFYKFRNLHNLKKYLDV